MSRQGSYASLAKHALQLKGGIEMLRTPYSKLSVLALVISVFVAGAAIADAVRTNSLGPIWMIGWLPAVLTGAFYRRPSDARCRARIRRRTQP